VVDSVHGRERAVEVLKDAFDNYIDHFCR